MGTAVADGLGVFVTVLVAVDEFDGVASDSGVSVAAGDNGAVGVAEAGELGGEESGVVVRESFAGSGVGVCCKLAASVATASITSGSKGENWELLSKGDTP